jgi:hypothetical protein
MPEHAADTRNDPPAAYDLTQRLPRSLIAVVLLLELGSVALCAAILFGTNAPWPVTAAAAAALLLAPAVVAAAHLRVRLDDNALRWTFFPFWRGSIPYRRIADAEPVTIDPLRDFGGWGPKLSTRGKHLGLGLIARGPDAVRITWTDKNRATTITTDHPHELAEAILRRAINDDTRQNQPPSSPSSPGRTI